MLELHCCLWGLIGRHKWNGIFRLVNPKANAETLLVQLLEIDCSLLLDPSVMWNHGHQNTMKWPAFFSVCSRISLEGMFVLISSWSSSLYCSWARVLDGIWLLHTLRVVITRLAASMVKLLQLSPIGYITVCVCLSVCLACWLTHAFKVTTIQVCASESRKKHFQRFDNSLQTRKNGQNFITVWNIF